MHEVLASFTLRALTDLGTIGHPWLCLQSEGTYFEGVSEVAGSNISLARKPVPLWEDPLSKLATLRTDLTIDRGMSFEVGLPGSNAPLGCGSS